MFHRSLWCFCSKTFIIRKTLLFCFFFHFSRCRCVFPGAVFDEDDSAAVAIFLWLRSMLSIKLSKQNLSFSGFNTTFHSFPSDTQPTQTITKQNYFVISLRWPLFTCQLFDFDTRFSFFFAFGDNPNRFVPVDAKVFLVTFFEIIFLILHVDFYLFQRFFRYCFSLDLQYMSVIVFNAYRQFEILSK